MEENLVIVESPAKAKTIAKILGKDFVVMSSFGHIRDLAKKNFGIDIKHNFAPEYIVSEDKKKVVAELTACAKKAKTVWLATDEDREGEAIAWHLAETLKLKGKNVKRIAFHEITKNAILEAIKNPRAVDQNLVNSQQARRILDRLVGFELSPVLWKKIKARLSAGRVQSVAVRLLVEREREIMAFESQAYFRVVAYFVFTDAKGKAYEFQAVLNDKIETQKEALAFLNACKNATFTVDDVITKPAKRSPSAPFTTSTLQQEASRKLGFSVSQTMVVAQKLYESGKITYMRTDSVNLSQLAINTAKQHITESYGSEYVKVRAYKTKTKGAQEAHEAIRPSFIDEPEIQGNNNERRLYDLIWKRTVASQMADAEMEKTTVKISVSGSDKTFTATGEVIKFEGFLKLYIESKDDDSQEEDTEGLLPPLSKKQELSYKSIEAQQKFTLHPPRYTEATLVKKLEELGIGRPSTYAPIISTIQQRGYVIKEDREGTERQSAQMILNTKGIKESVKIETAGNEKNKLFPKDMGMIVTDFLTENFEKILDYNFTASIEEKFDDIAEGKIEWAKMIDKFYKDFHPNVEKVVKNSARSIGERLLGTDPQTGKPVIAKLGRYGPLVQIGENAKDKDDTVTEKPKFASLQRGQLLETITLEEAMELFKLPRDLGEYEKLPVSVSIGRFGPYVKHGSIFISLKKDIDDPYTVELPRAIELINEKRETEKNKVINTFDGGKLQVLNGRWGPYISQDKKNYKIPKDKDPKKLTYEDCLEIIKNPKKNTGFKGKKKTKKDS